MGAWQPIGDPTPIGWTITGAYAVCTLACFAAWKGQERARTARVSARRARFWFWVMLGVLGLTLNKQLDLQVLASHAGRALFEAIHLGRLRRIFQAFFAVGFALVGGWFGLRLLRDNWSLGGHVRIAVAGVLELTLFVIVRVASAERLARWIGPFDLEWLRNSLEFLGIATIFGAALSSRLRQVRSEGE